MHVYFRLYLSITAVTGLQKITVIMENTSHGDGQYLSLKFYVITEDRNAVSKILGKEIFIEIKGKEAPLRKFPFVDLSLYPFE